MPWIVLLISAVFEAVWATTLGMPNGFTEPATTVVFLIALTVSMIGLGWSLKHIPIGTAYAVWVGIGAALTVTYAMATGAEDTSVGKVIFITGIITAVVGLKFMPAAPQTDTAQVTESDRKQVWPATPRDPLSIVSTSAEPSRPNTAISGSHRDASGQRV